MEVDPVVQVWARREPRSADASQRRPPAYHITFADEDCVEVEIRGVNSLTMVQYEGLAGQYVISDFGHGPRLGRANARSTGDGDIEPGVTPTRHVLRGGGGVDAERSAGARRRLEPHHARRIRRAIVEPFDAIRRALSTVDRHPPCTRPMLLGRFRLEHSTNRARITRDVPAPPQERVYRVVEKDQLLSKVRLGHLHLPRDTAGRSIDHQRIAPTRLVGGERRDRPHAGGCAVARKRSTLP